MLRMIRLWLIASVAAISGCAPVSGDFCEVVSGPLVFERETAARMVESDRAAVVAIDVQNRYWAEACGQ